jgi:hypothetical protein
MNKRIWNGLLIAILISWSGLVLSGQAEEQESSAEEAAPIENETKAAEEQLPSGIGWRLVRSVEMGKSGKFVHMVLVDKDRQMDKTVYSAAIHRLCAKEKEFCRIRFWIQDYFIPEKLTPTAEQVKAQKADHLFNRAGGVHRTLYSCTVDHDRSQCVDW